MTKESMAFQPVPREKPSHTGTLDWVFFGTFRQIYFQAIAITAFVLLGLPAILATAAVTGWLLDYAWFSLVIMGAVFGLQGGLFLRNYSLNIQWSELRPTFARDRGEGNSSPTRTMVAWLLVLFSAGISVFLALAIVLGEIAGHYLGPIGVLGAVIAITLVESRLNAADKSLSFIGVNGLTWLLKTAAPLSGRDLGQINVISNTVLLVFQTGVLGFRSQAPGHSQWSSE